MTSEIFPEQGNTDDSAILSRLAALREDDLSADDANAFAFIYDAGDGVNQLARKAFAAGMTGNGLDPTVYPSARRLENDIVSITLEHLRAPEGAAGTVTSGGTESVILAVKTARDHARKTRPHIEEPTILLPITAHASFQKAAHYLDVKAILVDVDSDSMQASMDDLRAKIDDNTILLVGSAPSYAHGVIDPIEQMGALAEEREILLHVDACIGGWVLPLQRELGVLLPEFDFEVPGVTSISVDLHKYAFTPKGISVLAQRNRELRDSQYYSCASWTGYSIINPTIQGSKSLAPMAAAWCVLQRLGKSGYRELISKTWSATKALIAGVDEIEGIRVIGAPTMGLLAITTEGGDIFEFADRLTSAGWHVQPTYEFANSPAHIHFSIDPHNAPRVPALLADMRRAADGLPETEDAPAALVQLLEAIAQSGGSMDTGAMMAEFGIVDGRLPKAQAPIHRLLNSCSPGARERLLTLFLGEMFS